MTTQESREPVTTHQQIANVTDEEMVERMVSSYAERFDDLFWDYFESHVTPQMVPGPTIVDVGCGPGLFLRDLGTRHPDARLVGTDVTRAMIDYASSIEYPGARPEFMCHDIASEPLPFADDSVDVVTMVALLHLLQKPFDTLAEIRRVLSSNGRFLLQDWIRTPLEIYLERMMPGDLDEAQARVARDRFMALFPVHNKYTKEDWLWLMDKAGFVVEHRKELRSPHFCTFVCRVS